MHVVLRCPCGANLKAPIKFVGRELKCPKCATMLIVPQPPTAQTSNPQPQIELLESIEVTPSNQVPTRTMAQQSATHPEGQNLNFASTMNEVESVFLERKGMISKYRDMARGLTPIGH